MSLFAELKRRNVFRVTAAYVVISWLLLQVGDVVFEALEVDASANRLLMALVLLGLIPTVLFSWAFEMTPEGIKRDKDLPRNEIQEQNTAKKLDYITMIVLVLVGGMSLWQHWSSDETAVGDQSKAETQKALTAAEFPVDLSENKPIDANSIAVLPFQNMANNPDNEPFTLGIHDDLLTHLSKISALKVISRTSVLRYAGTQKPIKEIAAELGVANILEGGVQRSGNQIRINVQLIDAETDEHLWAEIFDRELSTENIFKIQTEISEEITTALKAQLTSQEIKGLETVPTNNMDAYNAYLAGRQRMLLRSSSSLKEAYELFSKAIELDPNYALAYVGKADTLSLLNEYSDLSEEVQFQEGRFLIAKALEIDAELAEAHTTQASYFWSQKKFKIAETTFKYSLELNPNYATTYHWYGLLKNSLEQYDEALALFRKAGELDPLSPIIQLNIGHSLLSQGETVQAKTQYQRVAELDPRFPGAANAMAMVNMRLGLMDEAIVWSEKAIMLDPGNLRYRFLLIPIYLNMGNPVAAENELQTLQKIDPDNGELIYYQATLYLYLKNYAAAEALFANAVKENPDELNLKSIYSFYAMVNGNYQTVIDLWKESDVNSMVEDFSPFYNNLDAAINLAWSLKQSGENSQANELIEGIKTLLNATDPYRVRHSSAAILAIENKPQLAAKAYAEIFDSGEIQDWWRGYHLPYLQEMLQLSSTQEELQKIESKMEKQRKQLAEKT